MIEEFCAGFEDEQIPPMDNLNLLEVMDICSNLYLTHLLAVEILGYRNAPFSELGSEGAWIVSILSFSEQIFFRLRQIH